MEITILVILGLGLGSFVNALVWRIHEQALPAKKKNHASRDLSVLSGRSMCTKCGHTLGAKDLVPVLSWLTLLGRCRYCRKPISWQYPTVELVTALLFVASYVFWPRELQSWEILSFAAWLGAVTGLMALFVYDVRWMILPNRIVFPLYGFAAAFVLGRLIQEGLVATILSVAGGIIVGGGLFYLLFQISNGNWIGGGDVKLGFLLGALLASPLMSAYMLFLSSLLGSALALVLVIRGKASKKSRIPYGPFLIMAAIIVQLFGDRLTDWYLSVFINV